MAESKLTEVDNALQEKLFFLYQKGEQLKCDLQQVKAEQASVREAIIKLGHKPGKPSKKKKFRPTAGLIAFMAGMRLHTGPLPREYLKEEIRQMLAQRGHSIKGYSEAFCEAIRSPQFRHDDEDDVIYIVEVGDEPFGANINREIKVRRPGPAST